MNVLTKLKGHPRVGEGTAYAILFSMGFCHLLNDMIQSVIPAMYPLLKDSFGFTFAQIGVITLIFQLTSSVFQPFVGQYADRHPQPYSLAMGMGFTLVGLLILAFAPNYWVILLSVAVIGCGSSVFHPEASRVAQMASGGKKSLAQSIFQVGGNGGSAIGPLLAALIIIPYGQHAVGWFATAALLAAMILVRVGYWYSLLLIRMKEFHRTVRTAAHGLSESHFGDYAFLEILLYIVHDELFYFLFDREVRSYGADVSILSVCFFGGIGCRDVIRRLFRRPLWTEVRDSVFYPWCCTVYVGTSLSESVLDTRNGCSERLDHSVCFLGYLGICHGFEAG